MKQTTQFENVKLADIEIGSTNPRKEFDKEAIEELAKSITANGVIQPVVLRKGKKKAYELVCGERRHRASIIAKQETIPAVIRELTDDQALELQITENLQRKDIHPMDEAVAFKHWQDMKKYTIQDIAKRVGKSEKYVAGRLKLNSLIVEFQKELYQNSLNITMAMKITKLSPDMQRVMKKENKFNIGEHTINNYMGNLHNAPFDGTDSNLKKDMGPCTTCQFNTKNSLLFADEKEPKCGLISCFTQKVNLTFDISIKKALEDKEVVLVSDEWQLEEDSKRLTKQGHKVYNSSQYDDYQITSKTKGAVRAFVVEGDERGKYKYVRINKEKPSTKNDDLTSAEVEGLIKTGKATPAVIDGEIKKTNERAKRSKEIDEEHIAEEMYTDLKGLDKKQKGKLIDGRQLISAEKAGLIILLSDNSYEDRNYVYKYFGITENYYQVKIYNMLIKLPPAELDKIINGMARAAILSRFSYSKGRRPDNSAHVLCVEDMMKHYSPDQAKKIRSAHEDRGRQREVKVSVKIEKLKLAKKGAGKSTEKTNDKKAKA